MQEDRTSSFQGTPSVQQSDVEVSSFHLIWTKPHVLLGLATLIYALYTVLKIRRNLPPGPWGLPVVGFLPFLSAQTPHYQLEGMRKKYGDIFGMYLGSTFAVFLGNPPMSKECYGLDEFSGRPDGAFPISKKSTHFAAVNGQAWKLRRKLTSKALRHVGIGNDMIQNASREQIGITLNRIEDLLASSPKHELNVRSILTRTTTSIVLNLVFGKSYSQEHESYKIVERFLKFFAENGTSLSMDICMPWSKPLLSLLSSFRKESDQIFDDMENFTRKEIEDHLKNGKDFPKDLLGYYLQQYGQSGEIPIDDISGDAQVMIFAGADTVRGTTEWFLLCMAKYPEIQKKVYQEIEDVFGPDGEIRYDDKDKLPYTEAAIYESMRYKTLLPINPYHSCVKDTKFHGYDIPKGSLVFAMLWSFHNDPAYWSHPQEFHPEHFLSPDGSSVKVPEAFLPFSPGKRTCPGDKVALIEAFIFCTSLVRRFLIEPPAGGLNMDGNLRLNMEAVHPVVRLTKRSSAKIVQ